jgi:hypothetical protein
MTDFNNDLEKDNVSLCFISSVHALLKDMIKGNEITFEDAQTNKHLYAYTYYHPMQVKESVNEIEKYRMHSKFIGFKTRPLFHNVTLDHSNFIPLIEAACDIDCPILVHCGEIREAYAVAIVAKRYKNVKIIIAHACYGEYAKAMQIIKPFDNIYVEPVSSTYFPNKIRNIINAIGYERLMFGSDYGLLSRQRVIKTYEEAKLSSQEQNAIFRTNAERVFTLIK